MVTRVFTLKSRNIDMTQADHSGREGQGSRLRAREHGRELRLEKEETDAIIETRVYSVGLIRLHGRYAFKLCVRDESDRLIVIRADAVFTRRTS